MREMLGTALVFTAVLVIVMSSPSIFGFLTNTLTLTGLGSVKTVNVAAYWDSSCVNEVSTINWGAVEPGSSTSRVIYLKNEGNAPITLSLAVTRWSPSSARNYTSLSWNYSGEQIGAGNVVKVTLTLNLSSSISGVSSFTFDMAITGTG